MTMIYIFITTILIVGIAVSTRFKIPADSLAEKEFLECVAHRKQLMEQFPGFLDSQVENPKPEFWIYRTSWSEKVKWEEYMWSKEVGLVLHMNDC